MLDLLRCSAWWREQRPPYSTAEIHLTQLSREAIRETIRESAALRWRSWLQQHAPALVGQIGLDDVEPFEDGYQFTSRVTAAQWRFPNLTPRTYFEESWHLLDQEDQLACSLAGPWMRIRPTPVRALVVLQVAARLERMIGARLEALPVEAWFLSSGDVLRGEDLDTCCDALAAFSALVGQALDPTALTCLVSHEQPTTMLELATTLLAPLHGAGRPVPRFLACWYLRHLAWCSSERVDLPEDDWLERTRLTLQRITDLLCTFQTHTAGKLPVYLEGQLRHTRVPADLEPYLVPLVMDLLPAFLQATRGQRLPLVLLEALPTPKDVEVLRALAAVFSWPTWKRVLEQFQHEETFPLDVPPVWVVQSACNLLVIFGCRWHDWLTACQQKQGWSHYDASHWLPNIPAPGLGAWLMQHCETAQERLTWVAAHWNDDGFPRVGTLAQMRRWEVEEALRREAPGLPETLVDRLLALSDYSLGVSILCAAVQGVLPALRGEIPLDSRLVGRWELEEGRVLRFLAKTDPLGLALGEATNCCQQWGGVGQACMEAGYVRPDSAFLVLEHGEQLLAQAWVWIGAGRDGEALVLDNIEVPHSPRLSPNEVLAVVRSWAGVYAQEKGLGVKLGTGSADYMLSDLLPAPTSQLEDYSGYSDATYQRWLALPPTLAALPIGVRLATELDAYALSALEREIYPAALCIGVEVPAGDQGFTLLYEEEGQRLGYVIIQFGDDWQERTEGYVEDLAVLPSARRRAVFPLAEAFHRFATTYGLTHLRAHLRETTSYRLLSRHGARLGLVIEQEEGWEERACGERFMAARIRIEPASA